MIVAMQNSRLVEFAWGGGNFFFGIANIILGVTGQHAW
jgi:hypothetical protein